MRRGAEEIDMNRIGLAVLALAMVLAPTIASAETTTSAAGATRATAPAAWPAAPVKPAKPDTAEAGTPSLPIEVSPFMKPQLGLALPRM